MSWQYHTELDFLGTSQFQNMCCREVRKFLPDLEFSEKGAREKTFVAHIPMTDLTLYLYMDSAAVRSPTADLLIERSGSEKPEELVSQLIKRLSNAI